jgi:Zn finger protein HypA/HybF involved in hydrogenase expression
MHEVGLVAELVDAAAARAGGQPVAVVRVRHATTIPEDVLRQAFEMLTEGGPLATAELVTEPFDVRLTCPCGFDGPLSHDDVIGPGSVVCPSCTELRTVAREAELELLEVGLASRHSLE